jgi:hypothetical protein
VLGWVISGRVSVMPVGKREERRARGRLADRRLKEMRLGREERSEVQGTSDVGILGSEQEDTRHRTRGGEGRGREAREAREARVARGQRVQGSRDGGLACRFGTAAKPKEAIIAGGASRTHFTRVVLGFASEGS